MQVFFGIAYFLVGLFQFFAVWDGVKFATDFGNIGSFVLAALSTYVPLLGSALGVYGAVSVWDWSIIQSAALFFWYVPVFILMSIAGAVFDK